MRPQQNPFSTDPHPDLTAAILGVVNESHSRAELEKLGVARLRELKKKYEARVVKGDRDAARELADIHGLLRAKGGGHALDEGAQLDERIIDEVDFFQASKNLLKGKGFKTNREVSAAKVNANYAAMMKRRAAEAKGKTPVDEGCAKCVDSALKSLKAANTEDLKEKGGKAGERAHKRLHTTIAKVVGEAVAPKPKKPKAKKPDATVGSAGERQKWGRIGATLKQHDMRW